jgi:ribosomal protein L18
MNGLDSEKNWVGRQNCLNALVNSETIVFRMNGLDSEKNRVGRRNRPNVWMRKRSEYVSRFTQPLRQRGFQRFISHPPQYDHRLCIRITKTRIILQIIHTNSNQDFTVCQVSSSDLPGYGVPLGLTNVPAGFLTGALIARGL